MTYIAQGKAHRSGALSSRGRFKRQQADQPIWPKPGRGLVLVGITEAGEDPPSTEAAQEDHGHHYWQLLAQMENWLDQCASRNYPHLTGRLLSL